MFHEVDICYSTGADNFSSRLSNLQPRPFYLGRVQYGSIEGFLQSLKFQYGPKAAHIASLSGIDAKREGSKIKVKDQTLYYKSKPFNRHSGAYQDLLDLAYQAAFDQNEQFRLDLYEVARNNIILTHNIGKNDPFNTILMVDEFLNQLNRLTKNFTIAGE